MDASPLSSVPVGHETNWGFGSWVVVLALTFVVLCFAGVAATLRYERGSDRDYFGSSDPMWSRATVGFSLVAFLGAAILVWNIARHLPSWQATMIFYLIFVAAVAFFSAGMMEMWNAGCGWDYGVRRPILLPTAIAAGIALAAFVGDGAARSGIMREVPERIATGAGLVLYVAIAFVLVPFGTKMYLKANS